ncbi:MAG: PatU [Cyanobacteria bacterium P01_A01_bin.135]
MQDRFHALLKRRLMVEIEQNPPLFPWESELCEYEVEDAEIAVVSSQFWLKQIQRQLPVPMSEQLLADLIHRCQRLAQGSAQIGRQLVAVVEPLFPGQTDTLNDLAGLVLATAPRSSALLAEPDSQAGFPTHYDEATGAQQMALSLIAVREILSLLTITVPVNQPPIERQWMSDRGPITVTARYRTEPDGQLQVSVALPCRGQLKLQQDDQFSQAQRASQGTLSVDLEELSRGDVCTLLVTLDSDEPLTIALQVG